MSKKVKLLVPISGDIMPLSEVNDYLFNKKIMGEGVAIKPTDNFVYAPVDGEITLVYESRHAIGIKTEDDLHILIHVGIDSVKLEGRGFATYVKVGDKVVAGERIMFFDKEYLEKRASSITPIVIANPEVIEEMKIDYKSNVAGKEFVSLTLK